VQGGVGDSDALLTALEKDWTRGYGVFFGTSAGAGPFSATATVFQYASEPAAERAFSAAHRSYVSKSLGSVTELSTASLDTGTTPSFGVSSSDKNPQTTTVFLNYPGFVVQVSVSGDSPETIASAVHGMVSGIAQWAATSGGG
jgi:hypothetical protein